MLIDTHCHLDFPEFNQDRDEVIRRAQGAGVNYLINIGSSLAATRASVALAKKYDFIYATAGIHPHEADSFNPRSPRAELEALAKEEKVVAIGEIGLDYFKNYAHPENQKSLFISLLELARDLDKPVVIHSRQAQEDTLKILKGALPKKTVVHCFSADEHFLKECLALGLLVSFTCNITYRQADSLRGLVKAAPLQQLLLETDAPFLPPEGLRGRRNEPMYVKTLAEEVAKIKGIGVEEIARVTTQNAKSFFNL
ncbi:MAG: TatD family deoxyribonuclease [Candidatus Omnitrophica bacterium]|nr:TatD family deoxyribonuclease [Candidatus Omnitrophota bacterium]